MNNIQKLETIKQQVKEHNLTAYEIGKHTNISTFAIQKILKGETKKPNVRTLNAILFFIESAIVGTDVKNIVEEPKEEYYNKANTDYFEDYTKLQVEHLKLMKENYRLKKLLEKNNIAY
jgi:transcriptional regulator with XRE-family HTH domain